MEIMRISNKAIYEVAEKDHSTHILNFVFIKVRYSIDDHPGKSAPEVEDLMHRKGHDACSKDIILQVRIPGSP